MKKLVLLLATVLVFNISLCHAGTQKRNKSIDIVHKMSSYQKLKGKLAMAYERQAELEDYVYELEDDNAELREEFYSVEPQKEFEPVIIREPVYLDRVLEIEKEVVPWYYWVGLAIALVI